MTTTRIDKDRRNVELHQDWLDERGGNLNGYTRYHMDCIIDGTYTKGQVAAIFQADKNALVDAEVYFKAKHGLAWNDRRKKVRA